MTIFDATERLRERVHNTDEASARGGEWPDPLPLPNGLPAVEPLPPEILPPALAPWLVDVAERMQCPLDVPAAAALVCLGSVIGRRCGIRPKCRDSWLVVPNLWGAVVGRPGLMKSPAIKEAMRPLRSLEKAAADEFKEEQQRRKIADDVRDLERRAAEQQALKSLRAGTANRDSIENTLSRFARDEQLPIRRRFITNDPTVEKLVELLKENPAGILLHRDELRAWLASFEREGRESDRNFYLEAWAGDDSHTDDRVGRGTIDCDAACISVLGGLTPGPFISYLRTAAFSGRGDDGLLQRFQILVWPDVNGDWHDVDRWPDTSARRIAFDVFQHLANLDAASIGAEIDRFDEAVPFLRFDAAAQDEFANWRAGLEREVRSGAHHEAWDSYLAKHRSLVPSIALIDHLAKGGTGPVRLPSLTRALAWLEYLKSHATRVYDGLLRRDQSAARALGIKIKASALRARFSLRDVYNQAWSGLSDRAAVVAAVEVLCDLGWLRADRRETQGRTATEYLINPKLMARDGDEQA